ncbi:MAG: pseudouridine synthase [Erysipelotrichaceae bacterium]|nr:pseudouridine synthase [Erysipelotrichaceae bacterium]
MEERLQKVIAKAGIASRRKAEELINSGKVKVNGKVVTEMGVKVSDNDEIVVNGQPIRQENKVYYLLNKPRRTICSVSDEKGRDTVLSCFEGVNERIYPIGRLDYDTSGLLLMTNDGEFANLMMHPRYHLPKTYHVTVSGVITDDMARILSNGIVIDDKKTLPCDVAVLERSVNKNRTVLDITIYEGRNREIRKMMEYFHTEVTRLERIGYGFLDLGHLRQGEYRRLRMFEVKRLKEMATHERSSE